MEEEKYRDIIDQIKAMPKATLPDEFTAKLIGRLPQYNSGFLSKLKQIMLRFNFSPGSSTDPVSRRECSFYYFITGLFYLIIGVVTIIVFKKMSIELVFVNWMVFQPYIAIGMAAWLFALGVIVMVEGRIGIQAARYGTMFYIFFAVLNSLLLHQYLNIPYAIIFIIGLAATSAFMGIMLVQALRKMELRMV